LYTEKKKAEEKEEEVARSKRKLIETAGRDKPETNGVTGDLARNMPETTEHRNIGEKMFLT